MDQESVSQSQPESADTRVAMQVKGGRKRYVDLKHVLLNAWTTHTGITADRTMVIDCIESLQLGGSISVVLRTSDNRSQCIVTDRGAIEVFCRQFLTRQGYSVSDTKVRTDRS